MAGRPGRTTLVVGIRPMEPLGCSHKGRVMVADGVVG